jgi:hypothetical protein
MRSTPPPLPLDSILPTLAAARPPTRLCCVPKQWVA